MSKQNLVTASELDALDRIEVPVEVCEIKSVSRVPGQLKNRKHYLLEVVVVPVSGPWANCEGKFILESSDVMPLVKKYSIRDKRRAARRELFNRLWDRFFGPKVEPVAIEDKRSVPQWT